MIRLPLLFPPGINADDTKFSSPFRCVDADCVRWDRGKPQPIGGWNKHFGDQLTGVCRNLLAWTDLAGSSNIAFGTHSKLYARADGTLVDITPIGLAAGAEHGAGGPGFGAGAFGSGLYGAGSATNYFPRTWSLDNWGQELLAVPRGDTLYWWDKNVTHVAVAITNAPDNILSMLVHPQRRQVTAFGCNEETSNTFNPMAVRWCDFENYDDWTTLATNNAGERILEGSGRIVTARHMGPITLIWMDSALWKMEFTGDPSQNFYFERIATGCGLIGPNALYVANNQAWWITPDYQFYTYELFGAPQLVPCPIRDSFKESVSSGQFEKIAATSIGQFGEIVWFYPHADDGLECSRYVSLGTNVPAGAPLVWQRGTLARSACIDSGPTPHPIFVSPDGYAYSHEDGQSANGEALSWSFTISLPYLEDGGRRVMVKGIEPDIKDQVGAVSVSFEMKQYAQSTGRTYGPYILPAGGARKHFLFSGRSGTATFSGASAPSFARFGKPILLGETMGQE